MRTLDQQDMTGPVPEDPDGYSRDLKFNLQPFPGKLNDNYKIIKYNWFFLSTFLFLSQVVDFLLIEAMKATNGDWSKLKAKCY